MVRLVFSSLMEEMRPLLNHIRMTAHIHTETDKPALTHKQAHKHTHTYTHTHTLTHSLTFTLTLTHSHPQKTHYF